MSQPVTPTLKTSKRGQIVGQLFLALASVGLALAALELAARLLPPPYPANTGVIFTCNNALGWTGASNFNDIFEDANFRQLLTFNAQGMHDTDHVQAKPPHTFRVLLLGDSFVQAIQVAETETAHQILEDNLNQRVAGQPAVEVISAGVVNWGTQQELVYYREQGRHFKADLVLVLLYIGNDFADNLPGNLLTIKGFNCYAPYFAVCDHTLNPAPLTYAPGFSTIEGNCSPLRRAIINGLGWLYQHSRLYQHLEPLFVNTYPRETFGQNYPLAFTALYLSPTEVKLEQAYQITEATITQLKQEVEADGSQLAVAIIPPWPVIQLDLLSPVEREVFLRANPQFAQADPNRPNRRLAEFFNSQHIAFIDLTGPLVEYSTAHARIPLYITGEGHWTVEGNRVAAEIVTSWLFQSNFLNVQ